MPMREHRRVAPASTAPNQEQTTKKQEIKRGKISAAAQGQAKAILSSVLLPNFSPERATALPPMAR